MENISNKQQFNIAIIGRPNVGKSSIFNFLICKNEAYIKDEDGTTQDLRSKIVGDVKIWDTPGILFFKTMPVKFDKIFLVIENNILNSDKKIYMQIIKEYKDNVYVIVNKIDRGVEDYSFFKDVIQVSMKSRKNLQNLKNAFLPTKKSCKNEVEKKIWAIVGKPNVGKSTLINLLAQQELHKVKDEDGTTKEFLPVDIENNVMLDTPGQRKRAKFPKYSNVFGVILVMDFKQEKQDLKIINMMQKRLKPVMLIINKIDLADTEKLKETEERIRKYFDIPIIKTSFLKNKNINLVQKLIKRLEESYEKRITTSKLNEFLNNEIRPLEPKLKYITQIETMPAKFFVNAKLTTDKEKMLKRRLARKFGFEGVPILLKMAD